MLKEERQQQILSILQATGKGLTLDLSQSLEVSEDTIRRDLKELADANLIQKVHGGAILTPLNPFDYRDREVYAQEEKQTLAKAAIKAIREGQVIFMDGGTTNVELARLFPDDIRLSVFTNSLPIADILSNKPFIRTMMLGGKILPSAKVTIGPEVVSQIQGIRADLCILGTRSLHPELGISEIDWDETQVKRAMVQASQELMCLVIAEKINTAQPYLICGIPQISAIVTTIGRSDPRVQPFRQQGIDILEAHSTES
ncbi:MAG: DeoR/GlpR family DNA-binding transcription regulator [Bacteroidia bacterium]|nr:DeoR/GlpR family DNA-binding transcription regulator [Bacteroidia bacterium]